MSISNLPIIRTINPSPIPKIDLDLGAELRNLYNCTLYDSIIQLLRQRMGVPFSLDDVAIRINIYDAYCEAIITPRVLTASTRTLGGEFVLRYERLSLTSIVLGKFFFDGALPMSFKQFAQYIFDRYGFVLESGEFQLEYTVDGNLVQLELTDNTIITTIGDTNQGRLVVTDHSARWADGAIDLVVGEIETSGVQPLVLSWTNSGISNTLHIQLQTSGGVAPYTYSIVTPVTRYESQSGYTAYPVSLDSVLGVMHDDDTPVGQYTTRLRVTDAMSSTADIDISLTIAQIIPPNAIVVNTTLSTWDPREYTENSWIGSAPFEPVAIVELNANEIVVFDESNAVHLENKTVQYDYVLGQLVAKIYVSLRRDQDASLIVNVVDADSFTHLRTVEYYLVVGPRDEDAIKRNLYWTFIREDAPTGESIEREGNWITLRNNEFSTATNFVGNAQLAPAANKGVRDSVGSLQLTPAMDGDDTLTPPTVISTSSSPTLDYLDGHTALFNGWYVTTGTLNDVTDLKSGVVEELWTEVSETTPKRPSFHFAVRLGHPSTIPLGSSIVSTRDHSATDPNFRIQFSVSTTAPARLVADVIWSESSVRITSTDAIPLSELSTWVLTHHQVVDRNEVSEYQRHMKFQLYRNGVLDNSATVTLPSISSERVPLGFEQGEQPGGPAVFGRYHDNQHPAWTGAIDFCTFNWWDLDDELITLLSSPFLREFDQLALNQIGYEAPNYVIGERSLDGYVNDRILMQIPIERISFPYGNGSIAAHTDHIHVIGTQLPQNATIVAYTDPNTHEESLIVSATFDAPIYESFRIAFCRNYAFSYAVENVAQLDGFEPQQYGFATATIFIQDSPNAPIPDQRYWSTIDRTPSTYLENYGSGVNNHVYRDTESALVRSSHPVLENSYVEFIVETSSGIYVGPTGAREVGIGVMDAYPKINDGNYQAGSARTDIASLADGVCVYFPSREIVHNGVTVTTLLGYGNRIGIAVTPDGHVSIRDSSWAGAPPPVGVVTLTAQGQLCLATEIIHANASAILAPPSSYVLPEDADGFTKGISRMQVKQVNLSLDNSVGVSAYAETGDLAITWTPQNSARAVVADGAMPLLKAYPFDINGYIRSSVFTLPSNVFDLQFNVRLTDPLGTNTSATLLRLVSPTHYLDVIVGNLSDHYRFGLRYREHNLATLETTYVGDSYLTSLSPYEVGDMAALALHHFAVVRCNDGYIRLCLNGQYWSSGLHLPDFDLTELHYGLGSSPLTSIPYPAHYGQLRLKTGSLPIDAGQIFTPDETLT